MINIQISDINKKEYYRDTNEFNEIVATLKTYYNNLDTTNWLTVSEPLKNTILDDIVISAIVSIHHPYLDHLDPVLTSRKYLLNKIHIYEKVYLLLTNKTCEFSLPQGSNAIAKGYLVNVYGQPGDEDYSNYIDIYFSCQDHKLVESWANETLIVGKYSNYYCATFNATTKERLLVKNYWYDEQEGLSDWDEEWVIQCKKRGLDPLTELS